MSAQVLQTLSGFSRVLYAANITAASITKPTPTLTRPDPTAGGIVEFSGETGGQAAAGAKIEFFGTTTTNTAGIASIYGWELVPSDNNVHPPMWVPTLLCSLTAITIDSGMPGVAGAQIPASNFFATAITLGTGNSGISVEVVSPGFGNDIAHVIVSPKGARFLEVRLAITTAVDLNALVKVL